MPRKSGMKRFAMFRIAATIEKASGNRGFFVLHDVCCLHFIFRKIGSFSWIYSAPDPFLLQK